MTAGLPPNFRLNLTAIQKNAQTLSNQQEAPPEEAAPAPAPAPEKRRLIQTIQPQEKRPAQQAAPARQSTTLARKNLVVQSSDSDSDFDLDLESIPVGKEAPDEKKEVEPETIEAPTVQVSQLPELEDSDDDELQVHGEGSKLSLLYDLLLSQEQVKEENDEWSYRSFIKQFAISEAAEDNNEADDSEEEEDFEEDNEYDIDDD